MVDVEETYLNPVPAAVTKKKRIRHRVKKDVVQVNRHILVSFLITCYSINVVIM